MADETRNTQEAVEKEKITEPLKEEEFTGETDETGEDVISDCEKTSEAEEPECEEEACDEADPPSGSEEAEAAESEAKEKGSFFKRRKDKEKEKLHQQVEDLTDRLKRSMAEFDNFRKRTEKEKSSMYIIGAKDIVEKMLPVVDSFERGLSQAPEGDAFADGMQLIYKQLMTTLEDLGVKPIEAVGKEFDPNLHNAVMHVDDEEAGENVVVEEFQKGYTYKDFVVRHSMVKVAN